MNRLRDVALIIIAIAAAVAIVGIDDAKQKQTEYCQNVRDGVWPDYEGTYKEACGGEEPPQFEGDLTEI